MRPVSKRSRAWLATALALCSLEAGTLKAQEAPRPVSLPATHEHIIQSSINGRSYQVMVALPPAYQNGSSRDSAGFPVLYLLDGNVALPLLASVYRYGNVGNIAPVILVGIGWNHDGAWYEPPDARAEDYTPTVGEHRTRDGRMLATGGAATFARVLREEIIPLVEASYRVSGDRGILGNSYGGLFATYALLEHTDLFDRYVIASPSLYWDDGVMFAYESRFAQRNRKLPKRVHIAVGGEESDIMRGVATALADSLRAHAYEGLDLTTEVVADEGHNGAVAAFRGLREIYPLLVQCALAREGPVEFRGSCTLGNDTTGELTLRPPIAGEPGLWRGMARLRNRPQEEPIAVEIRRGGTVRTGTIWYDVYEASVDSALVSFGLRTGRPTRLTAVDLAIVRRARALLPDSSSWDPSATPESTIVPTRHYEEYLRGGTDAPVPCPKGPPRTFFCALYDASVLEAGQYWHGRPAIDAVRAAVGAVSSRALRHPLFDINSDPGTTLGTLHAVLDAAEGRMLAAAGADTTR